MSKRGRSEEPLAIAFKKLRTYESSSQEEYTLSMSSPMAQEDAPDGKKAKAIEEAKQLLAYVAEMKTYYRLCPTERKKAWAMAKTADWKTLCSAAPGSDMWKLKKKVYDYKKKKAGAKLRSKVRSYVSLRYGKKSLARSSYRSRYRYGSRRFGFRRTRSRW